MRGFDDNCIQGLVIKVASRCNLNCSYCYVYNKGDFSYRLQPKFMDNSTIVQILKQVSIYCLKNKLTSFRIIFHGGEPLLAPKSFFTNFVKYAKKYISEKTNISFSIQTNGVLLSKEWCKLLGNLNIRVGISMDGPEGVHNAYRVDHRGKGSFKSVLKGLRMAQKHKSLLFHPGVLLVVDPKSNPYKVYNFFLSIKVTSLNLLLPDGTHENLPPYINQGVRDEQYADWLIAFFDVWFSTSVHARPTIKLFQQIINLIMGTRTVSSVVGRSKNIYLVIETDGSIEAEDSLKVCKASITKEGMSVKTHSLETALGSPLISQCLQSQSKLPRICQQCCIRDVCGGGFVTHRYHSVNSFDNPSVYCSNLMKLIVYIQQRLLNLIPAALLIENRIKQISYSQALLKIEKNHGLPM